MTTFLYTQTHTHTQLKAGFRPVLLIVQKHDAEDDMKSTVAVITTIAIMITITLIVILTASSPVNIFIITLLSQPSDTLTNLQ